jgi:capsule polysaccharide export protein KpsC/LpsZ
MRRLKFLFQKNIYDSLDENDKFFLFPLQSQPEYSTLILARYFSDQVNTIKNAAFTLPFPYKLYVKEHPIVQGDRPKNFYRKIKQIPNVVLVSPYENVENLIKKSQGIVTLTGTIGMEAALAGKPVYVLGDVFYSYHPWCRKVKGFEELKQRIEADLNRESFPGDLENVNLRFIISYFRNTIAGDITAASSKNDANDYQAIYQDVKRMFLHGKTKK